VRSISAWIPALWLLSLGPVLSAAAQEAPAGEAELPVAPPAIELVVPAEAVEWAWVLPAAEEADADDPGIRLVTEPPQGDALERLGTIRFQYDGESPADALRIQSIVPDDLEYIEGSATGPGAAVEYDAEARQLSWTIDGPLVPGTRGLVSFRARPRDEAGSGDAGPP
jgi:hypothetical protein